MVDIIDPPSPFAELAEWQAFLKEMRNLPQSNEVREYIAEAEEIIAEKSKSLANDLLAQ